MGDVHDLPVRNVDPQTIDLTEKTVLDPSESGEQAIKQAIHYLRGRVHIPGGGTESARRHSVDVAETIIRSGFAGGNN